MTVNEELYKNALNAIEKLFSDKTVSVIKARENLESIILIIETLLDILEKEGE